MLVVHTCNTSYSKGRDQEDGGMRSDWAIGSRDSISKIPNKTEDLQSD
jgi:hypothetical protein